MKQNTFKPRGGAIIILCIAVAALWLTAVYGTYEDSQREKYSVTIKPGEVAYGTHSSAVVPMTVTTTRPGSTVPMVSASAVRSYAHHGHATMPAAPQSSGYTMHTTSSATVHTIGSGGGASGGGMSAGGSSASQRGLVYGSPSISMPMLAVNNMQSSMFSTQNAETYASQYRAMGPRRINANGDGEYNGEYNPADDTWWDEDKEEWVGIPKDGFTKTVDGRVYVYDSSLLPADPWRLLDDQPEPGVPVGAIPWLLMMALGAIYAMRKRIRGLVG